MVTKILSVVLQSIIAVILACLLAIAAIVLWVACGVDTVFQKAKEKVYE